MKKTCSRLSALLLAFILLLTIATPPVLAEDTVQVIYDFDYLTAIGEKESAHEDIAGQVVLHSSKGGLQNDVADELNAYYNDGTLNWNFADAYFDLDSSKLGAAFIENGYTYTSSGKEYTTKSGYFRARATQGDWAAFTVKNPGSGVAWSISMVHPASSYGTPACEIYILPADTEDIASALVADNKIGTVNMTAAGDSGDAPRNAPTTSSVGTWTAGDADAYTVVLYSAKNSEVANREDFGYLFLSKLIMSVSNEPEPDDSAELIESELALKNAVGSFTTNAMATAIVNGHDYVFAGMRGATFIVYDLDAGELVDAQFNAFTTPRSIHVDKDGIVWLSGAQAFMYRYDPYTKTGEQIAIPEWNELFPNITSLNLWGLTSDSNGNIYFATYNTSYIGMYNSKTGEYSRLTEHLDPDAMYAGTGGVILNEGYAYLTMDGNKNNDAITTHQLIKFDLTTHKVVKKLDLSKVLNQSYLTNMKLIDGVIFGSHDKALNGVVAVDITGEEMQLIDISGLTGIKNGVSDEIDGKVYFLDQNKQFQVYDIASSTVTPLGIGGSGSDIPLKAQYGGVVTVEGDDRLPGKSLVTYKHTTTGLNLIIYNPETKATVTIEDITDGMGTGNKVTHITVSGDGKTLYVGAYGINHISIYDVESGEKTKQFVTYSTQTEGVTFYDGYLYAGCYGACGILKIDLDALSVTPLFTLEKSVFSQHRMGTLTAGDGKVFASTAPTQGGLGGVLSWYDIEENRIYVAGGPNPEDVYYTQAENMTGTGWYSAVTNEIVNFDIDGDGKDDSHITINEDKDGDGKNDSVRRFSGVIKEQTINRLVYQDGYIIGSTDRAGGSGSDYTNVGNACLFVYDVEAMKVVETLDISKAIEGLPSPVAFIDVIAADPDVDGKYWGVVSDTLFSFTFNFETGKFTVTEELSFGKSSYNVGASNWHGRDMVFDGDFVYVVFPSNGTYMIERANTKNYYKLSDETPRHMVLAADNNLYFLENISNDIRVLPIAQATQAIKDPFEAADVQALIDALDDVPEITLDDEKDVLAARAAYDNLSDAGKALVDHAKLTSAESAINVLIAQREAASSVDTLIEAIGTVTKNSGSAIITARAAYNALSDAEKAYVEKLDTLIAAENAYAELIKDPSNPSTGDAVQPVLLLLVLFGSISAICTVLVCWNKKKTV